MYLCRELLHVVGLSSEEKETMALSIIFAQELAPEIGSVTCQRVGVQENADHPTGEPVISPDPTTSSSCTAYQTQTSARRSRRSPAAATRRSCPSRDPCRARVPGTPARSPSPCLADPEAGATRARGIGTGVSPWATWFGLYDDKRATCLKACPRYCLMGLED